MEGIDRLVRNVDHGRFERTLSGLTAAGALVAAAEIWMEHDRASFGNTMMWVPVALGYFHDHVRIEDELFDGALDPTGGTLRPDQGRPGLGLALDRAAAEPYRRR